jgi:hypothetical protein
VGDRLVQLRRYGDLYFVRQSDDRVFRTLTSPPLVNSTVVAGVAPENGWWIVGTDPSSGDVAAAVSQDLGETWTVRSLNFRPGLEDPVLVTADGRTVYVFVRAKDSIQQRRSTDGGESWQSVFAVLPGSAFGSGRDPTAGRLGAVVRADGSLLVWAEQPPGAIFVESTDAGASYHPTNGPAGPILALSDGYVALGDPPVISWDGRTWTAIPRPATIPPD